MISGEHAQWDAHLATGEARWAELHPIAKIHVNFEFAAESLTRSFNRIATLLRDINQR